MEIEGKIIEVLPERIGISQTTQEPWRVASYLLEIPGYRPTKMMFEVSDGQAGRIARLGITKGRKYRIFFEIEAQQYNGRWYNTVRAWDARLTDEPLEETTE